MADRPNSDCPKQQRGSTDGKPANNADVALSTLVRLLARQAARKWLQAAAKDNEPSSPANYGADQNA